MKARLCLLVSLFLLPVAAAANVPDHDAADTAYLQTPAMPCFAPGTPAEVVEHWTRLQSAMLLESSLSVEPPAQFQFGNRWATTATDGPGLGQGDPTTLTWSIVPDGTFIPSGVGEPAANSGLIAFLNGIYGSMDVWLELIERVFDRWGELNGITYVYEPNDDGANMFTSGGQLGVRGDLRIGGKPIDGNSGILAYNFFPNNGDMVIDSPDSFYNNTSNDSIRFRNVVSHEHGHGQGIRHVCRINQTKLMEPFVTTAFDGPQHDDILTTNRLYADDAEDNDSTGIAPNLGAAADGITVGDVSVDDNSDIDYYGFDAAAGSAVDVTLTPIGFTYLEGPQNANGSCSDGTNFNSLVLADLSLAVLDSDGSTVLASVDLNPAGVPEVLDNVSLPSGAGTYFVEVQNDGTNNVQLYQLDLNLDSLFVDGFESGDTSAWSSTVDGP